MPSSAHAHVSSKPGRAKSSHALASTFSAALLRRATSQLSTSARATRTRPRLEQHYREKDFWTSLIVFTAKDKLHLNKAHVQYLESRLVSLAYAATGEGGECGNNAERRAGSFQ